MLPDFISIKDACEKYYVSHVTINNKIKLFKTTKKREIDRLQSDVFYLINEVELQEALRIKDDYTKLLTGIKRIKK
jgi:hypothetical protein